MFQGCTQYFKDFIAKNQQQWIQGKIFGSVYLFPEYYYFLPLWSIMEWNSVCITVSSSETEEYCGLHININGHIVLQTKISENVFKKNKASLSLVIPP